LDLKSPSNKRLHLMKGAGNGSTPPQWKRRGDPVSLASRRCAHVLSANDAGRPCDRSWPCALG